MNWFLEKIPRIFHCYWGGGKLSYLRYLTIETFHHYNPDWEIRLYYPQSFNKKYSWVGKEQKYKSKWIDWFPMIDSTVYKMIPISWDDSIYKNMSEVHRSDYIRLTLLSSIGGLWSDMDILFIKSINQLAINTPKNSDVETVMCTNYYGHSIGFMMASQNNEVFGNLEQNALKVYDTKEYQSMGAELYNKLYPSIEDIPNMIQLGMNTVYSYNCSQLKYIFDGKINAEIIDPHTIGLHWYAGGQVAGDFLRKTKGGEEPDNSLIGRLIKNYERDIYRDLQEKHMDVKGERFGVGVGVKDNGGDKIQIAGTI